MRSVPSRRGTKLLDSPDVLRWERRDRPESVRSVPWVSWLSIAVLVAAIVMMTGVVNQFDGFLLQRISANFYKFRAEHRHVNGSLRKYVAIAYPSPKVQMQLMLFNEIDYSGVDLNSRTRHDGTRSNCERNDSRITSANNVPKLEILRHRRCEWKEANVMTGATGRRGSTIFKHRTELPDSYVLSVWSCGARLLKGLMERHISSLRSHKRVPANAIGVANRLPLQFGVSDVHSCQNNNRHCRNGTNAAVVPIKEAAQESDRFEHCFKQPHYVLAGLSGIAGVLFILLASGCWGTAERSIGDDRKAVFCLLGFIPLAASFWFVYQAFQLAYFGIAPCASIGIPHVGSFVVAWAVL